MDLSKDNKNISKRASRAGNPNDRKLVIGIIVIVILAVAAFAAVSSARKRAADEEAQSIEASIAESESRSIAEAEKAAAEAVPELTVCEIPEISIFVQEYFDARLRGDSSALYGMFGRNKTEADAETERKLKAQADWIQKFDNIEVYTAPGLDDDSRVCLVIYDIDFRRTDTLASGALYFYIHKEADGSYKIIENPVKEVYDHTEKVLNGDPATALIEASNAKLKEALDSDSTLALIYDSFRSGEVYKESSLELDKEQQVGISIDPQDSILIGESDYANIQKEAESRARIEASLEAEE